MLKIVKQDKKTKRRVGRLKTKSGVIQTPFFMPIATKGAVKSLAPEDLKALGAQIVLGNTYHLWLRPGTEIIKKAGGLHAFMNWPGPILTDSGGYQVFSLGAKIDKNYKTLNINSSSPQTSVKLRGSHAPLRRGGLRWGDENKVDITSPGPSLPTGQAGSTEEGRQKGSLVKISDAGAEFRDPIDGNKYFLTPEKSIEIQLALGSDIIMVLDECPPAFVSPSRKASDERRKTSAGKPCPVSREQVEKAVARTTAWARRCKEYFDKKVVASTFASLSINSAKQSRGIATVATRPRNDENKINRPLIFGIVQGGIYKDLRQRSARELLEIGFDGYAIGGVAVGEPRKYLKKVLDATLPLLPQDKPRYLMGLGKPEEIVAAVNAGIDMFDCVIPTREARHGKLYVKNPPPASPDASRGGQPSLKGGSKISSPPLGGVRGDFRSKNFYKALNILNAKFAKDFKPIDKNCACYTCQNYSRAYLHHLFKVGEPLSLRLATIHNLAFYLGLMEKLRK